MSTILWEMPVPSSTLTRGPRFVALLQRECELSYYVETDEGDRKSGILFTGVEAYKCTYMTSRSNEMINKAYDKLIRINDSSWLTEVKENSAVFYMKSHKTPKKLQHVMICFDEAPCYEVICSDFNIIKE